MQNAGGRGLEHSPVTSTVLSGKQRFPCSEAVFHLHAPTKANGHVRTPACRPHRSRNEARARKQLSARSAGKCLTDPAFRGFCSTVNDACYGDRKSVVEGQRGD